MVTTFYPPFHFGGDGVFVYRLSSELARRGHHVEVICCVDSYRFFTSSTPDDVFPHHANIKVHRLKSRFGSLSPVLTHQAGHPVLKMPRIRRILAAARPDVIHYHNISLVGGPGVLSLGNAVKLYTAHEYWLLCPLSILWKYCNRPCTKKHCFLCMIHAGRPPQLWRFTGLLERHLKHVDALIAPSRFAMNKHREMGLEAPFVEIPNFLPDPGEAGSAPHPARPFFLFVGRLEKTKGLHELIKVFRRHRNSDLLIAGRGAYESALRRLAHNAGHIRFLGEKRYEELKGLYAAATAVIVPSLWYEPFGLIVIEAFAHRTPVIVHDSGALPELVEQSGGGIVYRDEAGLLDAMESVLDDRDHRDDLGEKGYTAYRQYWTEETHMKSYLGLIEELLEKRSAASS